MTDKVDEFAELWDNEIKPFIDEHLKLSEKIEFRDTYGCTVLTKMGWGVEHDLADGRNPLFRILQTNGCLNDEEYYQNVHNNFDDVETISLRRLGQKVKEGFDILMDI